MWARADLGASVYSSLQSTFLSHSSLGAGSGSGGGSGGGITLKLLGLKMLASERSTDTDIEDTKW